MESASSTVPIPAPALWLGASGAVPFVTLAVASLTVDSASQAPVIVALGFYGAVILSFLGGVQWGLAIKDHEAAGASFNRLGLSVVPSLIAWLALLLPALAGLPLLAVAFIAAYVGDRRAGQRGLAPAWYPRLRLPLTVVVVASLLAASVSLAWAI
ncbi:MAG: DUF3429 domain-containing protein [Pseudomonadota bacterium]